MPQHPIKTARIAKGWSQEDLARHAGITYRTVWTAEQGLEVSFKTKDKIATALKMPKADLFGEPSEQSA